MRRTYNRVTLYLQVLFGVACSVLQQQNSHRFCCQVVAVALQKNIFIIFITIVILAQKFCIQKVLYSANFTAAREAGRRRAGKTFHADNELTTDFRVNFQFWARSTFLDNNNNNFECEYTLHALLISLIILQ